MNKSAANVHFQGILIVFTKMEKFMIDVNIWNS